jgi:hypothetical protein
MEKLRITGKIATYLYDHSRPDKFLEGASGLNGTSSLSTSIKL